MTPEEWWDKIADCIKGRTDHMVRAALRERDAAWAAAIRKVCADDECVVMIPDTEEQKGCGCLACAPLRALLEEAGRNEKA